MLHLVTVAILNFPPVAMPYSTKEMARKKLLDVAQENDIKIDVAQDATEEEIVHAITLASFNEGVVAVSYNTSEINP